MNKIESDCNRDSGFSLQPLEGIRILLVEDEPDLTALFQLVLEQAGAEVMAFESAEPALADLESLHPDLLLCNIRLPAHDGNWLIRQIRFLPCPVLSRLPAIAITSYNRMFYERDAFAAGFQAFLSKPLDPDVLVEEVLRLTSKGRLRSKTEFHS